VEAQEALKELFQTKFGEAAGSIAPLKGDGSGRSLYRLKSAQRSVIGAVGPDARENTAFLGFSRHFRAQGLPVPEIYAEDLEQGLYLEEDLGETNLFQLLSATRTDAGFTPEVVSVYERVVDELPRFQIEAGRSLDYTLCYPRGSFDKQSMMWDLNYFKYYFLRLSGVPFDEQALEDDFEALTDLLLTAPRAFFLYRDFQSRNVMVRDGRPWFIDYQGGRKGALQYDIASLLYDAKADMPFPLRDKLLTRYISAAGAKTQLDEKQFRALFPGFVYIRIMQAMGAYGLRGFYERKAHFLQSIPYAVRNIERLLQTTELPVKLPALMSVFRGIVGSAKLRSYGEATLPLTVRVQSFSFKNGAPTDEKGHGGGFVFDCRGLPNPGREVRFKASWGTDPDVIEFLEKEGGVHRFLDHAFALVDQTVETYQSRNFTDLMVSFGCTGGQHRSVYCAERLARHLRERYKVEVVVRHRERPPKAA
jgi:aminoglycoside/choline kinase family phosphotransferase